MSNQTLNQAIESMLLSYLLHPDYSNATENSTSSVNNNPLTERNLTSLLRVAEHYQRNVELYHTTMSELVRLLYANLNLHDRPIEPNHMPSAPQPRRYNRFRTRWNSPFGSRTDIDMSMNVLPPETRTTRTYTNTNSTPISSNANNTTAETNEIDPSNYEASGAEPISRTQMHNESRFQPHVSTIQYSSNETETRCPISFEDFSVGENVCKINSCGHIFKQNALYTWLNNNNNTCPVCRSDVVPTRRNRQGSYGSNAFTDYSRYISLYDSLIAPLSRPVGTYTIDIPLFYDNSGNIGTSSYMPDASNNISYNYDYIYEDEEN